jgi:hypothetical protein
LPQEPSIWIELAKSLPGVVTAITAVIGVSIAYRSLNKWHDETVGKRKAELAEQALIAFYEARDVFTWVRSRGIFGGEGGSRSPAAGESETQQEKRNTYFIPIERLTRDKELFARIQTLRYAFTAHFGEAAGEPFRAIWDIHTDIISSASVLIQITHDDEDHTGAFQGSAEPLLHTLGWGTAARPDDIDRKIDQAVQDIEKICRPVLTGGSS